MFYYYLQLSGGFIRCTDVRQSTLYSKYALLECMAQLRDPYIDRYKLIYLGHGHWHDKHIQENLSKYKRQMSLYD